MIKCDLSVKEFFGCPLVGLQILLLSCAVVADEGAPRLWPTQTRPAGLVGIRSQEFEKVAGDDRPGNLGNDAMLAQSVAGLAALAVNEGLGDELVYIDLWDNFSYQQWRSQLLERTKIEDRGNSKVWDLVSRYHQQGIVAGYILYRDQQTEAQANASTNVATSLSGILRGIIVSESQEATAKQLGLTMLLDARGKTESWCFETYRNRFSRKQLLLQRYRIPNNRAIAIAHQALTIRGDSELAERVYEWLEAPALIHGWNSVQDEGASVRQISSWGHVLCPSDWAMNLPALSVDSEATAFPRIEQSRDRLADATSANETEQQVAFLLTDGDNLQWVLGDFAWNDRFWAAPELSETPFGFGLPIADLLEVAPDAYLYFQRTKPKPTSIAVAPSYVYLDHLGVKRAKAERSELLIWYARRIEKVLERTGLSSIVLICDDLAHARTQEAWKTLASKAPSLSTVFVMQYHPYEAGEGRVWEIKRTGQPSLRVVSASYSLWSNIDRLRAGTPGEISRKIGQAARSVNASGSDSASSWVAVHAWSKFAKHTTDQARSSGSKTTCSGAGAATACAKLLGTKANIISPDSLASRYSSRDSTSSTSSRTPSQVLTAEIENDGSNLP